MEIVPSKDYGLSIGRGRPHVADFYVKIDGKEYVKGKVKHPDHKTIDLLEWHLVYSNNEFREAATIRGLTWID